MNGIIYCIINIKNGKRYVGQTTVGLRRRYKSQWWKQGGCHNAYLKNSIEKYGIENFEWEILASQVPSINQLNLLEIKYATQFNSYIPNGYNIRPCGGNTKMAESTKQKISQTLSKRHILKDTKGNLIEIVHLASFCKQNHLNRSALLNLLSGLSNYSQGYLRPETNPTMVKMAKTYKFITPQDEAVEGTVTDISKRFGIKSWILHHLVRGTHKTSHGWRIVYT